MITQRKKFYALQEKSETFAPIVEYVNFVNAYREAVAECIPTKLRAKHRVPWAILAVRKKRDNMKTASLRNKRNSTNAHVKKLKAQRWLFKAYQKEQM